MKIDRSKNQTENLIERYLLRDLPESDQTAFEARLLSDQGKFDQVCAVEMDLVDSYVRGEMSPGLRERFERGYLAASSLHRERVKIAEAFLTNINQGGGERAEVGDKDAAVPWPRWLSIRPPLLVVGVLLVITLFSASIIWSRIERSSLTKRISELAQREHELSLRNQEFEKEIADVTQRNKQLLAELEQFRKRPQQPPSSLTVLSFLLAPPPVRSNQSSPQSTIPHFTGKAQLLMEINGNDYRDLYAIVQTVEGREILRRQISKVRVSKDQVFAALLLKPGELAKGDYILALFGRTSAGKTEEIDRYFFRIS